MKLSKINSITFIPPKGHAAYHSLLASGPHPSGNSLGLDSPPPLPSLPPPHIWSVQSSGSQLPAAVIQASHLAPSVQPRRPGHPPQAHTTRLDSERFNNPLTSTKLNTNLGPVLPHQGLSTSPRLARLFNPRDAASTPTCPVSPAQPLGLPSCLSSPSSPASDSARAPLANRVAGST